MRRTAAAVVTAAALVGATAATAAPALASPAAKTPAQAQTVSSTAAESGSTRGGDKSYVDGQGYRVFDARGSRLMSTTPRATDYPFRGQTDPSANDAHTLTERQCTGFAGWWLYSHGVPFGYKTAGSKGIGTFGNATTWDSAAKQAGFLVTRTPRVGAVAQWHTDEKVSWTEKHADGSTWSYTYGAGQYGHVAIVTKTYAGGFVDLVEYNSGGDRSLHTDTHVRAPRYLVIGT